MSSRVQVLSRVSSLQAPVAQSWICCGTSWCPLSRLWPVCAARFLLSGRDQFCAYAVLCMLCRCPRGTCRDTLLSLLVLDRLYIVCKHLHPQRRQSLDTSFHCSQHRALAASLLRKASRSKRNRRMAWPTPCVRTPFNNAKRLDPRCLSRSFVVCV